MWYLVLSRSVPDKMNHANPLRRTSARLEDQHKAGRMLFSDRRATAHMESALASDLEAKSPSRRKTRTIAGDCAPEILEWDPRRAFEWINSRSLMWRTWERDIVTDAELADQQ
jgi:hypothetical protein